MSHCSFHFFHQVSELRFWNASGIVFILGSEIAAVESCSCEKAGVYCLEGLDLATAAAALST